MFRFENFSAFYFFWTIPFIVVVGFIFDLRSRRRIEAAMGKRLYPYLSSSVSQTKRRWKTVLQILALCFFIVALARPQMGQSKQEIKSEGVEIILAVDVSESMMAEDVKPSRLAHVKVELARLLDLMPGNKVGILAFAGSAGLLSPITTDNAAIKMYLDTLDSNSVSTQGTSFQEALNAAKQAFERGGVSTDETNKVTRVILIASDGEDHEPGAIEEAKKLAQDGTRIFTLAFGTEKGGAIPERDNMGFLKGYKKDRSTGQTIITTVKGDALRALAEAGSGSFYFATFGGNQIKNIVDDINKLEKTQFDTTMATQYDERFQWFLLTGIMIALCELVLGERRHSFRFWKGRFEVPNA